MSRLTQIIDRIGDKWTIVVEGRSSTRSMRFNALTRTIPGMSQRMLTLSLRAQERDGLVRRTAFPTISTRVDCELTEMAHPLTEPFGLLAQWAGARRTPINAEQKFL